MRSFGKVVFTGSHENAVLALAQGTVRCRRQLVERRGRFEPDRMLPRTWSSERRHALKKEDFRIIFKSDLHHQLALCLSLLTCPRT